MYHKINIIIIMINYVHSAGFHVHFVLFTVVFLLMSLNKKKRKDLHTETEDDDDEESDTSNGS